MYYEQLSNGVWCVRNPANGLERLLADSDFSTLERADIYHWDGTNLVLRETDTYLSGSNPPRRKTSPKFVNQYSPRRRYHDDMEPSESALDAVGGFWTNAVPAQAVFVDVNRDGMLDCFLQNGETPREGNPFEWKLILGSTNGWNVATGPVASGPETISPVVQAGTNDFYRIWLSESDFYVVVFTCGDGSVGSIRSPLPTRIASRPSQDTKPGDFLSCIPGTMLGSRIFRRTCRGISTSCSNWGRP